MKSAAQCLLIFVSAFISLKALAETQGIFSSDSSMVNVLVQGPAGDSDSSRLYNSLAVPAAGNSEYQFKGFSVQDEAGRPLFGIQCKVATLIENYGSCTVKIHASPHSSIEPDQRIAVFRATDSKDVAKIMTQFLVTPGMKEIFQSTDGRLLVHYYESPTPMFEMIYIGK